MFARTCFRLILERCHANQRGTFGRTILHDVVAMGRREGVRDWITDDEVDYVIGVVKKAVANASGASTQRLASG